MKFPKWRLGKAARMQRILKPESTEPKYSNPYFPKIKPTVQKNVTHWFKKDGWAVGIATILCLGGFGYFLLGHSFFQITSIEVDGNQRISIDNIKQITQSVLDRKLFGYIPESSYWVVQTKSIDQALREQLKQGMAIDQLVITKKFPHTISIQVKERIPSMNWVSGDSWFELDPNGVIVQPYATAEDRNQNLPTIIDLNMTPTQTHQAMVTPAYVAFLRDLQSQFSTATELSIDHFEIPIITCQQKQFVAEQAIENELSQVQDETIKAKIRKVQEQFQAGEIDIDTSLQLIEDIRNADTQQTHAQQQAQHNAHIALKAQYVAIGCDLQSVLTDVSVKTTADKAGFSVYLDSTLDLTTQLNNLKTVLREKITNPKSVNYIDIRYTDRVYYK